MNDESSQAASAATPTQATPTFAAPTDAANIATPPCKRTPLFEEHVKAKGKIVEFAGYELPVEYPSGLIAEHKAVREACGIFDVSHMGEVTFEGKGALASLNHLLTNDFTNLGIRRCRYALMCNDNGGAIDDLIVYRRDDDRFLVVVNAANRNKDVAWMREHLLADTTMNDISDSIAQVALQGPCAQTILERLTPAETLPQKYYSFVEDVDVANTTCLISRTGYTGEDGFELYCAAAQAPALWKALLDAGQTDGLIPCGLGARDTLRLEAAMPLYGHEMDDVVTPFDTGLAFGVKLAKDEFIGKEALEASAKNPRLERIGLEVVGRGIVREHTELTYEGKVIGHTTSGTLCPGIGRAVAMALVDAGSIQEGNEVQARVRNREITCKVIPLPFYKRAK